MTLAATLLPFRNIQGYVSPLAVVDALLVVAAAYFLKAFIIPAVILHRKSKYLDQLAGTTPKHWFYGHMLEVTDIILVPQSKIDDFYSVKSLE